MFSRDTLITGAIGHKLDENGPILFGNLLFANGFASVSPSRHIKREVVYCFFWRKNFKLSIQRPRT